MSLRKPRRPMVVLVLLSACLLFTSVMGIGGGIIFLQDTTGAGMGMSLTDLARTPFSNFFIPGLILLFFYGVGGMALLYALWAKPRFELLTRLTRFTHEHWAWDFTLLLGVILLIWVGFQLVSLPAIAPIQYVMVAIALACIGLPLLPAVRRWYSE